MTSKRFHALARRIFAHEGATLDQVRQEYWMRHFAKLITLVRNSNLRGIN